MILIDTFLITAKCTYGRNYSSQANAQDLVCCAVKTAYHPRNLDLVQSVMNALPLDHPAWGDALDAAVTNK